MNIKMHPGEFIKCAYLQPLNISSFELAEKLQVSPSTVSRIINGKMDVSYEMAVRLSIVLGRSIDSWVKMQSAYSVQKVLLNTDMSQLTPLVRL